MTMVQKMEAFYEGSTFLVSQLSLSILQNNQHNLKKYCKQEKAPKAPIIYYISYQKQISPFVLLSGNKIEKWIKGNFSITYRTIVQFRSTQAHNNCKKACIQFDNSTENISIVVPISKGWKKEICIPNSQVGS
jgi:hypothetical protein